MKNFLFSRTLPTQRSFTELLKALKSSWDLQPLPSRRVRRNFFDTFDWRLHAAGLVLEVDDIEPAVARLRSLALPSTFTEGPAPNPQGPLRNWSDGQLRNALLPVAGTRALLPQGAVQLKLMSWNVFNRHGKLLARIDKEQWLAETVSGRGRTVLTGLCIRPLRGYKKAGRKMLAHLPRFDADRKKSVDPWLRYLRHLGLETGAGRRPVLRITPGMGARDVLCRILKIELEVMERNLDGVMRDIDSEFLHDFRIAGRRSRSLFAEFQETFSDGDCARFREDLGWLSKVTCERRDLDVMLQMLDAFQARRPGVASGLQILRGIIETGRIRAHGELTEALSSPRLSQFFADWRGFLSARAESATAPPQSHIGPLAGESMRRILQKFLRDAQRLETEGYSEALHDLRKTGKKLRYLLESFRELYTDEELVPVLRDLRKLQNSLGDIVDSYIQREFVRDCLLDHPESGRSEMENRELQRLAQNFVQIGIDAGRKLRERLRELTAQRNLDRLDGLFRTGK